MPVPLVIMTTAQRQGQVKPQRFAPDPSGTIQPMHSRRALGGFFIATGAAGQRPWLLFDNHLFHKAPWKWSYSQAGRYPARTQSRDQQGCTVCAAAALITSITDNPARDETQGPTG